MRLRRQTSHRTEASYLHYIVDFIRFHGKRHARELGVGEIRAHLSYQAPEFTPWVLGRGRGEFSEVAPLFVTHQTWLNCTTWRG
jgi:hypothetical protein